MRSSPGCPTNQETEITGGEPPGKQVRGSAPPERGRARRTKFQKVRGRVSQTQIFFELPYRGQERGLRNGKGRKGQPLWVSVAISRETTSRTTTHDRLTDTFLQPKPPRPSGARSSLADGTFRRLVSMPRRFQECPSK